MARGASVGLQLPSRQRAVVPRLGVLLLPALITHVLPMLVVFMPVCAAFAAGLRWSKVIPMEFTQRSTACYFAVLWDDFGLLLHRLNVQPGAYGLQ